MAKHVKGKFVSKGSRLSCNKLDKHTTAIIARCEQVEQASVEERVCTTMGAAFRNMKIAAHITNAKGVVGSVLKGIANNSGNNKVGRGWTANLSPRTVKKLVAEGVFA